MNYTKINAHIVDQTIQLTNIPLLASGGVNEILVNFTFCSLWDGTARVAVFYRDPAKVYHVPIVDSVVTVPQEVTAEKGAFFMGAFGIVGDTTRTTNYVQLDLEQGACTTGENVPEPAQDVYQQILSAYAECGPKAEEALDLAQRAFDRCKPKAGFIYPLATEVVPEGFLLCDGAEYGREEYPELFAAIGTMYGEGDGETTFNVPNLQTRVPVGADGGEYCLGDTGGEAEHTLTVGEMPNHRHYVAENTNGSSITVSWSNKLDVENGAQGGVWADLNGAGSGLITNDVGNSQPHNNMQPYTVVNYIIATGKDTAVSVSDIILGAQAIPLEVQYGGTGATGVAQARENLGIYEPVLLWENASPESNLAASEFTIRDGSKYKGFIIDVNNYGKFRINANSWIHIPGVNVWSNGAHLYKRSVFIFESETGVWTIHINDCFIAHLTGQSSDAGATNQHIFFVDNSSLIISAVYGIKGVGE